MNEIIFVFQVLAAALFIWFIIVKDIKKAATAGMIAVKSSVLAILVSGAPDLAAVSFAGLLAVVYFTLILAAAGKNRIYIAMLAVFISAGIFGGCIQGETRTILNKPVLDSSFDLKFVPSVVKVHGKDSIYIGAERGKFVNIYDISTKKKRDSISTGLMPVDMVFYGHKIYIANKRSNTITIYDTINKTSENIYSGGQYPSALAPDFKDNIIFAANMGGSNVSVIDLEKKKAVKKIQTGKWPSYVLLSSDGKKLYVTCKYTNTVEVIDAEKRENVFTRVNTGTSPVKLISLNKKEMAVINEWEYAFNHQSAIIIFDKSEYSAVKSIRVNGGVFDGVVSKSGKYLYLSSTTRDSIIFIDLKTKTEEFSLPVKGETPKWLELSEEGKFLYVSCQNKKVLVIKVNDLI